MLWFSASALPLPFASVVFVSTFMVSPAMIFTPGISISLFFVAFVVIVSLVPSSFTCSNFISPFTLLITLYFLVSGEVPLSIFTVTTSPAITLFGTFTTIVVLCRS